MVNIQSNWDHYMDVNNAHLKHLLDQADAAFKALMQEPNSSRLSNAYEYARKQLNDYLNGVKSDHQPKR